MSNARRERDRSAALRRAIEEARPEALPPLPPKVRFEIQRKILHVVVAVIAVPTVLLLPYWIAVGLGIAGIGVISATWAIERRRLPRELAGPFHDEFAAVLAKTRRPNEDFPWSPVLYTGSLVLIATAHEYLGLSWAIALAAYAILGLGDAASALVGVAYGRRKLPWNRKKSVEGTLAGLTAGYLAGVVFGAIPYFFAGLAVPPLYPLMVLGGAAAGALSETLPRVEDNFVVPMAASAAMFAIAAAMGLPLPP